MEDVLRAAGGLVGVELNEARNKVDTGGGRTV